MNIAALRGAVYRECGNMSKFAERIGWNKNRVSKMAQGKFVPDIDQASKITEVLGLTDAEYLQIFLDRKSPNGDDSPQTDTD